MSAVMCVFIKRKSFFKECIKIRRNILSEMILFIKDEKYVQLHFLFYTLQYRSKVYINLVYPYVGLSVRPLSRVNTLGFL